MTIDLDDPCDAVPTVATERATAAGTALVGCAPGWEHRLADHLRLSPEALATALAYPAPAWVRDMERRRKTRQERAEKIAAAARRMAGPESPLDHQIAEHPVTREVMIVWSTAEQGSRPRAERSMVTIRRSERWWHALTDEQRGAAERLERWYRAAIGHLGTVTPRYEPRSPGARNPFRQREVGKIEALGWKFLAWRRAVSRPVAEVTMAVVIHGQSPADIDAAAAVRKGTARNLLIEGLEMAL